MFGIKFIKLQPTTYLLQYRSGQVVREGPGLSFFYYAPTTSLVAVPVASTDVPFIFQEKKHIQQREALEANIGLEDRRKNLVALATENAKAEADARAYGVSTTMKALGSADTKILQALATTGMKPEQLIAFAFQELAGNAEKIGQLNISPDLLRELLTAPPARK